MVDSHPLDSRPLEGPAEIRVQHTRSHVGSLRLVLISLILLMLVFSVIDLVLAPVGRSTAHITMALGGVALVSFLLLRRSHRRWASPLVVTGLMVITAWGIYTYGSVRAAAAMALVLAVVLAGTHLRLRALGLTMLGGMAILGGVTWAESRGYLVRPPMLPDVRYWLLGSVVMAMIGTLLYQMRKATEEAYLHQLNQYEDRLRLEDEREQSLRHYQRIFRLNPTALMVQFASKRTILEVNPAFERRFGYAQDAIVGQSGGLPWVSEGQWQAHCRRLFERGHTDWEQAHWRHQDGRSVEVLVSSSLNEDEGGTLILTTVVDASGA